MVQPTNAQTTSAASGVTAVGSGLEATDMSSGVIKLVASSSSTPTWPITFQGAGFFDRQTTVRVPGPDAVVSLIPASFDLTAFDQMFRTPLLQRWVTAPPLVIERRALQFAGATSNNETAVDDQMTDDEYASLTADLTWALPQLTGGTFQNFGSVKSQTSASGASVLVLNPGQITLVRVVGLLAATGYDGYSRWQYQADGTVTGGVITLDRDFDRSGSNFVRPLRAHELGHALGYNHVTSGRVSLMNPTVSVLQPTQFDLDAARIAFARHPGNRSPDNDLTGVSTNAAQTPQWSGWIR